MVIKLLCGWPPPQSVLSSLTPLMICIHLMAHRRTKRTGKVTKRKGRREDSWTQLIAKACARNCRSTLIRSYHHPITCIYIITGQVQQPMLTLTKQLSSAQRCELKSMPVYDLDAFFGRLLIVGQKRDISIADLFNYELAPIPPSHINGYGCFRKSDKSILVRKLGSTIASPSDPDILLIDGNQLLYHMV